MRRPGRAGAASGFSLIELLVGVAITALLMTLVATVMGQVVVNDSALNERVGQSAELAVIRRTLMRDLQNIYAGGTVSLMGTGLSMSTTHNVLVPGPFPVDVTWSFDRKKIIRLESVEALGYGVHHVLREDLAEWRMEVFEPYRQDWMPLRDYLLLEIKPNIKEIRLTLRMENGQSVEITERVPYVWTNQ